MLTKREEIQLLVFKNKVLRTICDPRMVCTGGDSTSNSRGRLLDEASNDFFKETSEVTYGLQVSE
jgi:hypothetical protein